MKDYKIIEINDSNLAILQKLIDESIDEGHVLGKKLLDEWKEGNTFSKKGEKFWALTIDDEPIAMGGINKDPYTDDETVARVRHIFVTKSYRRQGLATVLLKMILAEAKKNFRSIRLSTKNIIAGKMYESFGFVPIQKEGDRVTYQIADLSNI
ncbi:MAG: GNAT family N-acetyltransferase [Candidatus Pacebacteria bacterium]|nr:GNAT family N-acetyltransferase [Candidatus Paceibacterota bacterium]